MAVEILLLLSLIFSSIAVVCLFVTASKCNKQLKSGIMLIGIGVLISVTLHSAVEFFSRYGYLCKDADSLMLTMSILILIGSLFFIAGTYQLHKVVSSVYKKKK